MDFEVHHLHLAETIAASAALAKARNHPFLCDVLIQPPEQWTLEYAKSCPTMTLMLSPDGVFGHYLASEWNVLELDSGMHFVPKDCYDEISLPHDAIPRHVVVDEQMDFEAALALIMRRIPPRPLRAASIPFVYVRGEFYGWIKLIEQSPLLAGLHANGFEIASAALYISQAQVVTNLHVDDDGGFVLQLIGTKTFSFFAQEMTPHLRGHSFYRADSPCYRRSWISSALPVDWDKEPPEPAFQNGCKVTVQPGELVYTPPGVWHEVRSNDDPTMSIVFRLKK